MEHFPCAPDGDHGCLVLSSPVSNTRAARQPKAEASRLRLWRWVEKSRMESSHSPNPRRHWNLCSTKPLQKTSFSSDSIDLTCRKRRKGKESLTPTLQNKGTALRYRGKETITFTPIKPWERARSWRHIAHIKRGQEAG